MKWLLAVSLIGLIMAIAALPTVPVIAIFALLFGFAAGVLGAR